jgi:hypothetical protein
MPTREDRKMKRLPFLLIFGLLLICGTALALGDKITICHYPPGNPENAWTIDVTEAALRPHLAHKDTLGACPQDSCGVPSPVPETGQTECWDEIGNPIDCAGTGQDGEYQSGVSVDPRFTDNGDGTVTDNLTGLIWLQDANCFGSKAWSDALTDADTLANGYCGLMDGSEAGYWRLPNIRELYSVIDFGQSRPALPPGHPFFGVQDGYYWSSTTTAPYPSNAFLVRLGYGYGSSMSKAITFRVWPVRDGE